MSSHPVLRPETGVTRGAQRFGASVVDPKRDELRDELKRFEALADPEDAEQQKARLRNRRRLCAMSRPGHRPHAALGRRCERCASTRASSSFVEASGARARAAGGVAARRRLSARSHARAARGAPGVTRDWNAPPPAGGPPPAAALQELKDWKAAREKQRLLEAGLPLPPELRSPLRLEPPRPPPKPRVCRLRTQGLSKEQFLAALRAECEVDWPPSDDE